LQRNYLSKLSVGYRLDEIHNDITRETLASFEPTIDYVVTKVPRFTFEKFPQSDATLTTQMKSVGEAMAIGRTFKESLQKALRSLEVDSYGFESRVFKKPADYVRQITATERDNLITKLQVPSWERMWYLADAIRAGFSIDQIYQLSGIDPWFLSNIAQIVEMESVLLTHKDQLNTDGADFIDLLREAKQYGFADRRLAFLWGITENDVREMRHKLAVLPVYKRVDTCGAEFEAFTPYFYSTYEEECEAEPTDRRKIIILGGGPNRIGQGIEFDYCCVHGAFSLAAAGFETIMVNCNPETVSTDYDTSDRLYFEPVTLEDVLAIVDIEKPEGVIVQYGGQTPLKLAMALEKAGVPIIGTSPDAIDRAEDRERFQALLNKLNLLQPQNGIARAYDEAEVIAERIGYPVVVRPSYVLGGRAMEIVYGVERLRDYMKYAVDASPEHPVLVDKFLQNAIEVDVDALSDGTDVVIGGIMQHIEEAGIHSGDSACTLPPFSLPDDIVAEIKQQTIELALELKVIGLMNIQFAVKAGDIYLLEVNPRASRTVPFVSKATGRPLAQIAAKVMAGQSLSELGVSGDIIPDYISVKEAVFPFVKFPTGEVMGIDYDFGHAYAKSQLGAGVKLPHSGKIFISIKDADKDDILEPTKKLVDAGFSIVATSGTADFLNQHGIEAERINKVKEGRPHCVDAIKSGEICLVFNTTMGAQSVADSYSIRRSVIIYEIAYFTTMEGIKAGTDGILAMLREDLDVKPLQEYYPAT